MFYTFCGFAIRLLLRLFTACSVEGLEHFPRAGPALLVSNHLNLIDPPLLGSLLPRHIAFMAKEELFPIPVVGWVVKAYGAFSVKRGQPDRQALRTAVDLLEKGRIVGVFPEGTRSRTGKINRAHPGAALIALLSGAPVLPVSIVGTDLVRSPLSLLQRPRIIVRIGSPFHLERKRSGRQDLGEAVGEMMGRVAALLPEERRGHYASVAAAIDGSRDPVSQTTDAGA